MKLNKIFFACTALLMFATVVNAFTVSVNGVNSLYQETDTISGTVHGNNDLYWAGARIYDSEANTHKVTILGIAGNNWPWNGMGHDVPFSYNLPGVLTPGKYHAVIVDGDNWWGDKEWATKFFYFNKKPVITQPTDTNVLVGETATYQMSVTDDMGGFTGTTTHAHGDSGPHPVYVSFSGDTSLTYKWDMSYNGIFTTDYSLTQSYSSGTSFSKTITHQYSSPGTYTVAYKVMDSKGGYDLKTFQVTVEDILPPVIDSISVSSPIQEGATETISASVTDPMGGSISYNWKIKKNGQTVKTSTASSFTYTFATAGTYSVKLIATNSHGASATQTVTVTVTVANQAPVISSITVDCSDLICLFTGSATDANGDALTYTWDFDDGNTGAGKQDSHTYATAGSYMIELTVSDGSLTDDQLKLITVSAGSQPPPNQAPTAAFTIAPTIGNTNTVFTFTDNSVTDGTESITNWVWDFGDGGTSASQNPTHQYAAAAGYTVTLTVTDQGGQTNTIGLPLTVTTPGTPGDEMPIALAGQDQSVYEDNEFTIYGSGTDPDGGDIVLYEWDFDGDGVYEWSSTITGEVNHIYENVGAHTAVLRVTDNEGNTDTDFAIMTVTARPDSLMPIANAGTDQTVTPAQVVTFMGTGTDMDGNIVLYEWDFDGDGVYEWSSTTTGTTTHSYTITGTYVARFRVTDNDLLTAIDTAVIYVTDSGTIAPTAYAGTDKDGETGEWLSFVGAGTDADGYITLYEWDFSYVTSDGFNADWSSTATGVTTHRYTRAGVYVATLRVTDNDGSTNIDLVTVDISGPDVGEDETSGSKIYDFHLHALDVYRTYDYDEDEAVTTIKLRVTNLLGEQRNFLIRDVIPKDFAKYVDDFDINPQPDYVYNMDPEIGWNITLGDHESFLITYEFEKYINISDFEDWAAPVITEYDIPEADTEDEGEDTATGNFTGMVFGAFATPWFGLIAFIIIIVLVIAVWKKDYIVQKWNSWSESE